MRRIVPFFLLVFLLLELLSSMVISATELEPELTHKKLHVLSTIKPIQAIVLAIAGDQVESTQLIPAYASPHNYNFKPSDIRKIKQADVIFRIDENMEVLLAPALKKFSRDAPIISLADDEDIHLLTLIGKHNHTAKKQHNLSHEKHDDKKNHDEQGHDDGAKHQKKDLHIWASPKNMQLMAKSITKELSRLDVSNAPFYRKNLTTFTADLLKITQEIESELASVKHQPYVIFHNSWHYFIKQFGLEKPLIIAFHEGLSAGIKRNRTIRKEITSKNISCVFSDPSITPNKVYTLVEGLDISSENIDILGTDLVLNKNTSIMLLKEMSQKIKACLKQ